MHDQTQDGLFVSSRRWVRELADEERIPSDRASLLRPVANMALVLLPFSSLAPRKYSVAVFMFH